MRRRSSLAMIPAAMILAVLQTTVMAVAAESPDSSFLKQAAENGISQIEFGQLAQSKASAPGINDFGALMVGDFTAVNHKLKAIAKRKHLALPKSLNAEQAATRATLEGLSGNAFDTSYLKTMADEHHEAIQVFQREASAGRDPTARALAKATLPTLQAHLDIIRRLGSTLGVSTT